ncbi:MULTISPECIES: hypothetical protein [unclassified Caballeronia]|uniref:hypothetical protein n=1 Tax=unclassified Caballeronia TaxID=2646786 RepID=UPI00285C190A|nr:MULTISPECIES: hypothetical protein [unclassified Caballeronia]MDR5777598.1 hypothetical protein [Caballeronia sp. LZ002]MDR5802354.1 hypothetical protein [Caballeronia sp. LZ001]MDR5853028.1 hypothetical protein [Caballeronia sp. LZ003]
MKTCHEIRKDQLRVLAEEVGGVIELASIISRSETQVRQWLNASKDSRTGKPRGIADDMARYIEKATGKPVGWMDNDPARCEVPGWDELGSMQQAKVIGFIQGLLAQAQHVSHTEAFIENTETPAPAQSKAWTRRSKAC